MKNSLAATQKIKQSYHMTHQYPAKHIPKGMKLYVLTKSFFFPARDTVLRQTKTYKQTFTEALFIIAKTWENFKGLSTNE